MLVQVKNNEIFGAKMYYTFTNEWMQANISIYAVYKLLM